MNVTDRNRNNKLIYNHINYKHISHRIYRLAALLILMAAVAAGVLFAPLAAYAEDGEQTDNGGAGTDTEVEEYSKIALAPVSPDANFDFYGFDSVDNQVTNMNDVLVNGFYTPVNLTQLNKR